MTTRPPITHEPHRTCNLCHYKLPPDHFAKHATRGRQATCRKCASVYLRDHRAWKKANATP